MFDPATEGLIPGPQAVPQDALDFISQAEQENVQEKKRIVAESAKGDLLSYCGSWLDAAQNWRQASFEESWRQYSMHSDGKYDPHLSGQKKDWQSKAFYPLIPNHRESIHSAIYTLLVGTNPPIEIAHGPGGDEDIASDIRDLIVREMNKTRYGVAFDSQLNDSDTYGSGFARVRWEKKTEKRVVKKPVYEPLGMDPRAYARRLMGQPQVLGYEDVEEDVVVYNGVRFEWINIWDFFPDPLALEINGNTCAIRHILTLGKVQEGVNSGIYLPDAFQNLENEKDDQSTPMDKKVQFDDRAISDTKVERPKLAGERECFDLYARLPLKWVYPLLPAPIDFDESSGDNLVPAVVRFHKKSIIGVFLNDSYCGEPPVVKMDYIRVPGRFYGRGIPEMLSGAQDVVNEVVNQRLDNGNLALNKGFAVIEKALLNPKDVIEGKPGFVARLDAKVLGPNGDVRQAFVPLDLGDIKVGAGFSEIVEWERVAQERTSANRTTMGTGGETHDNNKTATGQVMQKEAAGNKFKYVGFVMELDALKNIYRRFYELIYQNIDPQEVVWGLGEERAARFLAMVPQPEEVSRSYSIEPQGIFEMDNRSSRQARLQMIYQQFAMVPWIKPSSFFDEIVKSGGDDPSQFRMSDQEMELQVQQMVQHLATQPVPQGGTGKGTEQSMPMGGQMAPGMPNG